MAQRRMTSLDVIDTDAFLDMPQSSQLLYFHLNARADDDGFVANPKRIMRDMGSPKDDLSVLAVKKFILIFTDGICVIKHWRINNFVRKDIYKETKYLNLKSTLFIRPNGAYTLKKDDIQAIPVPQGHYTVEDVNAALTKRQLSIGKLSKDKYSIDREISKNEIPVEAENILDYAESGFDDKPEKLSSAKFNKATDEVFKYFCEKFNFFRKTNKGPAPHTVDSAINVEKTSKAVREHFSNDIETIKKYIDTLAKQAMKEGWFKKVSSFRLLEKHLTNYQRTATKSQSSGKYDTPEQLQAAHEKLKKMRKEAAEWEKERNRIDLEEYNENEN